MSGADWRNGPDRQSMPLPDGHCRTHECRHYRVVRHYRDRWPNRRTILTGLTLAEARAHCNDPETSSSTATGAAARARTRRVGAWFDGYTDR